MFLTGNVQQEAKCVGRPHDYKAIVVLFVVCLQQWLCASNTFVAHVSLDWSAAAVSAWRGVTV